MFVYKRYLIILIIFFISISCLGWGGGHHDNAKLVLKYLPEKISKLFSAKQKAEIIKNWCKYPDSHKVDPGINLMLGKECLERMKKQGISTYALHSPKGKVFSFIELEKAFKNRDFQKAAFWSAVLMHSIADESAFNHGPLIHYMTYARYKHIKYPSGIPKDLSVIRREPSLDRMICKSLKNFKAQKISRTCQGVLIKIMLLGIKHNTFMTARETRIARGDIYKKDALKAMSEVAALQVKDTVNVIYTAWLLAQKNQICKLTPQVIKDYQQIKRTVIQKRSLKQDSIYEGLLKSNNVKPRIGLILEGSRRMNEGQLGFSSKFISSCMGRVLLNNGLKIKPVKCLDLGKTNFISASKTSILIICNGRKTLPRSYSENIKKYLKNGGKLIWIGGRDLQCWPELSKILVKEADNILPVSKKYGLQNSETVSKTKIYFVNQFAQALSKKEFTFKSNPNTSSGWQKPWCPYSINLKSSIVSPLCMLRINNRKICISAIIKDQNKKNKIIFLPEYLIAPFLLSNDKQMPDWSRPVLDSIGQKLLLASVKLLQNSQ